MGHDDVTTEALAFMKDLALRAGEVLLSYFSRDYKVDLKDSSTGRIDIVTDADRASEDLILAAITKEFPAHDILSEETPMERTGSRWLWLVDPLDGTVNFAHRYPVFCVSIALMEGTTLCAGVVHDPLRRETFSAARDRGAFLNGEPIRVSRANALNASIVGTGFPYDKAYRPDNNLAEFGSVLTSVQGVRRSGSAAIDLAHVAAGRLDGFWELKLKPWDMGAGMILVEEAGGRVSDRTGGDTDVFTRVIVATNGLIHEKLLGLLRV